MKKKGSPLDPLERVVVKRSHWIVKLKIAKKDICTHHLPIIRNSIYEVVTFQDQTPASDSKSREGEIHSRCITYNHISSTCFILFTLMPVSNINKVREKANFDEMHVRNIRER